MASTPVARAPHNKTARVAPKKAKQREIRDAMNRAQAKLEEAEAILVSVLVPRMFKDQAQAEAVKDARRYLLKSQCLVLSLSLAISESLGDRDKPVLKQQE